MKLLGLIGYPLGHSFSKGYFTEKFRKENIDGFRYENFPIPSIDKLEEVIENQSDLIGFNVTIPYKELIIKHLTDIDPAALSIGAVNTVKIIRKGDTLELKGFNTDVWGFENTLLPLLSSPFSPALILGTGGASKAVRFVLEKKGIPYHFVSRKGKDKGVLGYNEVTKEIMNQHKLIINTTPVGMYPHAGEEPALPYSYLTPEHVLYDLIYNPSETRFLEHGRKIGCQTKNGLDMLHLQAEKAWEIFTSPSE